jgi:tRNA(adenine34) deaminase
VQLQQLIYGAEDEQRGYSLIKNPLLHPRTEVLKGIRGEESKEMLLQFFQRLRS